MGDPGDRASLNAHKRGDPAADVAEGAKAGGILDHTGQNVPGPQMLQEVVQGLGLGRSPGEQDGAVGGEAQHLETHRLSHPGQNGNLPGAAVGNAQGSLLPGDESPETSQINHQIVEFIAFDTHGLKNFPAPPGPAQGLRGGDGQILQPLRTIGRHIDSLTFKNPICPILCPAPPGYAERSIPWTFVSMMYWK